VQQIGKKPERIFFLLLASFHAIKGPMSFKVGGIVVKGQGRL
jgi:hypothetical protein